MALLNSPTSKERQSLSTGHRQCNGMAVFFKGLEEEQRAKGSDCFNFDQPAYPACHY
jgi:hypothetical protein